jgi:uncharacterized membrane protein
VLKTTPRAAILLLSAALTACKGSGDDGTNPPPTPTIAIAASPASVNITAGSNGQTGITLIRGGGYTGAVALSLEGAPAGVTGGFNPATIATGATTSTLTIDVAGSTAAGNYTLTVRATGSGVAAATATVSITVAPPPSFDLSLTPSTLNITQGAGGNSTVNITRGGGFAGGVTLALEGAPAGITGTFTPNPASANSSALAIAVANTVAAGNYALTVRGTATGLPAKTATVTVTVLAPAGSFTLSMTPATLNITQGQTGNATININRTGGFSANVTLSLEGAPAGVTSSFTPNPASGASSAMAVTVGAGVAPGNYNMTVRGTTPNPSPDGSLSPAAVAQMAPDQTLSITISIAVAGGYSLSATAASAPQGGTGTSTITLNRTGGNTSSVTLALEGAPAGVTGSFAPNPAAGGTSTLTLTVGAAVAIGSSNVTVRGTAAGLADQTTTFQLTVTAAGGFTLTAAPTALTLAPGANGSSTITINRTGGFTGAVNFSHTTNAPAGVTISFNPVGTTGNTSTMNVSVGGGVAVGSYSITVKANSPGQSEQTTTVALTVQSAGGGSVTWSFCAQSGVAVWAAYQNGTGGAWTASVGVGNTFSFNITDTRGGIAWVVVDGASADLNIVYGSVAELQANAPSCAGNGTTKTVNGTMANLVAPASATVYMGGGSAAVNVANQANFAIPGVADGGTDLFAVRTTSSFFPFALNPTGAIIRRGMNVPPGGNIVGGTLDWSSGEVIVPVQRSITTNETGLLQSSVLYQTINGTAGILGTVTGNASPYTFWAIPDADRGANELHILTLLTAGSPYAYRSVTKIFAAGVNQVMNFAADITGSGGFTTAATVPYLRPRTQFTNTTDYNRLVFLYWANAGGTQNSAFVTFWEGYGLGLNVDYTLPDFSPTAGWNNAWGLQSGVGNVAGGLSATGWVGGAVGQQPSADGTTSYTAGRRVDNISP